MKSTRIGTGALHRIALAALFALLAVPGRAQEQPDDEPVAPKEVVKTDAGYSVHANASSLPSLLTALGSEAGFRVVDSGKAHVPVTVTLENAPLDAVLRRLLRDSNFIIVYRGGRSGTDLSGQGIEQITLLTAKGMAPAAQIQGSPLAGPQVASQQANAGLAQPQGEQPGRPRRLRPRQPQDPNAAAAQMGQPSALSEHPVVPPPALLPEAVAAGRGQVQAQPFDPGALGMTGAVGESIIEDHEVPPDEGMVEPEAQE